MGIEINLPGERNINDVSNLGVALKDIGETFHVGILYKVGDAPARIYHLAWHHALSVSDATSDYGWIQSRLPDDTRRIIAVGVSRFAARGFRNIPYSPHFDGQPYFNKETYELVQGKFGRGLTCSTFILAMHQTFGVSLLKVTDWPERPGDEAWLLTVVRKMSEHPNSDPLMSERIKAIRENPLAKRYRPCEVATAVGSQHTPINVRAAEKGAQKIAEKFRSPPRKLSPNR